MKERKDNLERRITNKEISFVGVIFSEEEVMKDTSEVAINRLKHVLQFVEKNSSIKLFMVKKEYLDAHFFNDNTGLALICTENNTNVVLARQATTSKTKVIDRVPDSKGIANDRICKDRRLSEIILVEIVELISMNSSEETIDKLSTFIHKHSK